MTLQKMRDGFRPDWCGLKDSILRLLNELAALACMLATIWYVQLDSVPKATFFAVIYLWCRRTEKGK